MRVVVAQEQPEQIEALRQILLGQGLECGANDCVSFAELPVRLAQGPADLLLLHVGADAASAIEVIPQAQALSHAPILALGPAGDARHILQMLQSGARGYLDETKLEQELQAALEKLRVAGAVKSGQGLVVGVVSATPGSGVTTVATNLAFTWADKYPEKVALVELGRESADLALSLDLDPRHTVADLVQHWQRMDAVLVRQSMAAHPAGVQVLAQKPATLRVEAIDPRAVRKAVILMRTMYAAAVLDLGHSLNEEHFEAMRLCDFVAVVVRLDIPAVRQTRQLLELLQEQRVPAERVRLIANRYGQRGQLAWKKAEEAIGAKFAEFIPEDCGRLNQALNHGQPLVKYARGAAISRGFTKLAGLLNGRS